MSADPAYHRLGDGQFRSIASGYGDGDALAELRSSQLSKRLLLLQWIRSMTGDEAVALIDSVGRNRPGVVRGVLALPFVDAWAGSHGRLLESGRESGTGAAPGGDPQAGAYLAGLAAAIALRAGVEADLPVASQPGQVVLPGIGLAYGLGAGPARIRCGPGRVAVVGPDRTVTAGLDDGDDRPYWCPARSVELEPGPGPGLAVAVDDLDPYRARFGMALHPRLRPSEVDRLARNLVEAWHIIATDHPGYTATVRECLRSIVPLAAPPGGGSVSGTARRAFGAVAVSPQRDGAALALLLIHELQHVKHDAVVDLVDLVDPAHTALYEAPWRADPRPAGAVLTGAYAHTGVADYWRIRRHRTDGDAARFAHFEFAYWREQTARSLETLSASAALTEPGRRFVDSLRTTVETWRGEPAQPGVDDLAVAVSVGWRLRNHHVTDADLDTLVDAWNAGRRPAVPAPVVVAATPAGPARVGGPAARLRRTLGGPPHDQPPDASETALFDGDPAAAAGAFAARITADDGDDGAWAGLVLAWRRSGRPEPARVLARRPELVRALTGRLDAGPERIATWLAESTDQL